MELLFISIKKKKKSIYGKAGSRSHAMWDSFEGFRLKVVLIILNWI